MSEPTTPVPPDPTDFSPIAIAEIEIDEPLPRLERTESPQRDVDYGAAQALVTLHGEPLGMVQVPLPEAGLGQERLAAAIEASLGDAIDDHFEADGLPRGPLGPNGFAGTGVPRCRTETSEFLARAPLLTVAIPTRDRPQHAAAAIASILACDYPAEKLEVILVDNRPDPQPDGNGAVAGALSDPRVRILHEPVSGGANARNRGLAEARGEIVAFTDDDVVAHPALLATIARGFDGRPNVGAVTGLVAPLELETPSQVWFEGYTRYSGRFERRAYDLGENRPKDDPLFPFNFGILGTGANMAFRTAALREAGGFDPAFNTKALPNGTDVEALLRTMLRGWTIVRDARAIVRHAHQREYPQFQKRVFGYGLGLTAVLTKTLLQNPRLLGDLVRRLPRGVSFAISSGSEKNSSKASDFPPELNRLELRGMVRGPLAYARGSREARRARRTTTATQGKPKLRVLLVTDSYPPLVGGATFWSRQVALQMLAKGHEVTLATSWQQGAPAFEMDGGLPVHRLRDLTSRVPGISADPYRHNPPPFPDPEAVLRLRRLIRKTRPDLVHSYGWLTHSAAAALLGLDVPMLVSTQDYGNVCALRTLFRHGEICGGSAPAKCLECAGSNYGAVKGAAAVAGIFGSRPLLRRKVTRIHSISRYVAAAIERDLRAPAPISIVPNFAEELEGEPVDNELFAALPAQPFVFFVGALRRVKGIPELIAAYQLLADPPPLVLAGPLAPDTPDDFPAGVTVLPSVPHATVIAMWERALFGVFPSRWAEPLGNVVYEAMGQGRAVIGTRPGGHEDMIDDGVEGFLVDAGDVAGLAEAMRRLIADPVSREAMGARARLRAMAFTAPVVLPELEALYEETAAVGREPCAGSRK